MKYKEMSDTIKKIKWDEETIAEHDKERGTRQKIEEADTPYERNESADDGEAEDVNSLQRNQQLDHTDIFGRLNAQLTYVQYRQQQQTVEETSPLQAVGLIQDSKKEEIDEFKEKRAGHYGRIDLAELRKMTAEQDD